jgi:hypothetical protein
MRVGLTGSVNKRSSECRTVSGWRADLILSISNALNALKREAGQLAGDDRAQDLTAGMTQSVVLDGAIDQAETSLLYGKSASEAWVVQE